MPFNQILLSGGRRFFSLSISAEDLSSTYDVEAEVISNYGISGTIKGDSIQLNVAAVNVVAATTSGYAVDADGLHDEALFEIVLAGGGFLSGRGGDAGRGGLGWWDAEPPAQDRSITGQAGGNGGAAIRYGCDTTLSGTGTVRKGYGGGGGGGGGATSSSNRGGGGGGGGGAPLGAGGVGGGSDPAGNSGSNGTVATVPNNGTGGTEGHVVAGDGGDGGDTGSVAQAGEGGTGGIGAAGSDGDAIHKQGFAHSAGGGITITGPVV